MPRGLDAGRWSHAAAERPGLPDLLAAKRRAYNRQYMRAWRADPRHRARERAARERAHYERKVREALRAPALLTNNLGEPLCGFCRRLPAIEQVFRLRICEWVRGGYVEVRLPYCGQC